MKKVFQGIMGGLLWFRHRELPRAFSLATLVLAFVVSGWMGYTANLGGKINHPEIRSADTVTVPAYEDSDDD